MKIGESIWEHMRWQDVEAFRRAAIKFKVHILVRRTNPQSLKYIGQAGYMPKPIDCKPKTADRDVMLPSGKIVACAGLVVNPLLPGFEKAFAEGRFGDAVDEWRSFSQKHGLGGSNLYSGKAYLEGASIQQQDERTYFTIDRGGVYAVQPSHESAHYGCLMFCPLRLFEPFPADAKQALTSLVERPSSMYIHGDYDLFGIVPADMPAVGLHIISPPFARVVS